MLPVCLLCNSLHISASIVSCLFSFILSSASMPRLVFLQVLPQLLVLVLIPVLVVFSSIASVVSSCPSDKIKCGNMSLGYPFGVVPGCGDPDFQVHGCNSSDPYIVINHKNFYIRNVTSRSHSDTVQMELGISDCFNFSVLERSLLNLDYGSTVYFYNTRTHSAFGNAQGIFIMNCSTECKGLRLCDGSWCIDWPASSPSCTPIEASILWNVTNFETVGTDLLYREGFVTEAVVNQSRYWQCSECWNNSKICGYNASNFSVQCFPVSKHKTNRGLIIGVSVAVGVFVLLATVVLVVFRRRLTKRRKQGTQTSSHARGWAAKSSDDAFNSANISVVGSDEKTLGGMHIFSYEELREATDGFSEENEIGDGGFGSVFKGRLLDGRMVAVKRLYQYDQSRRVDKFLNEASVFNKLHHPHVVRLYGCTSPRSADLMLVFEFLPNGALADHLHGDRRSPSEGLPWDLRLRIAAQTAEALAFLHSLSPPVFHRDVKSSNILLDAHFDAKIADFGLCKPVPGDVSHVTTVPQGTPGYVDPEYHECYQLTEKSDVYSYGVVLAEILSGKAAVDVSRERRFINLASMAVMMIQQGDLQGFLDEALTKVMKAQPAVAAAVQAVSELAFRCLAPQRDHRPAMGEVAHVLAVMREAADVDAQKENSKKTGPPFSPTSVHDVWASTTTTPNNSAGP